jgi:succinate dehydrogenase / fumarate reductase cytochrome b subunit
MRRVTSLYSSSIGKKVSMALTGLVLFGFVFVHMIGNLKLYQGAEKFDSYAKFLREFGYPALGHGQFLWIARIVLLGCVALHALAAWQVTRVSRTARSVDNRKEHDLSFSYASRFMRWGGVILAAFVVYHILHLTVGVAHQDFSHESAYRNVVSAFRIWPVSLAYLVAMVPLGMHIYHGLWSSTQTLALTNPKIVKWRRPVAAVAATVVTLGNISSPLAVLAGLVR